MSVFSDGMLSITTDTATAALSASPAFAPGTLGRDHSTDTIYRYVEFDAAGGAGNVDVAVGSPVGSSTRDGNVVSADESDAYLNLCRGVSQHVMDVSEFTENQYGWVIVRGLATLTNHDATIVAKNGLTWHGDGETDVAIAGEPIFAIASVSSNATQTDAFVCIVPDVGSGL